MKKARWKLIGKVKENKRLKEEKLDWIEKVLGRRESNYISDVNLIEWRVEYEKFKGFNNWKDEVINDFWRKGN
jgi:hypothetical protein